VHQEIKSDYHGGHGAFPDERESSFFKTYLMPVLGEIVSKG
jgi:hypothetical protein